jgi:hypothetical protein
MVLNCTKYLVNIEFFLESQDRLSVRARITTCLYDIGKTLADREFKLVCEVSYQFQLGLGSENYVYDLCVRMHAMFVEVCR